MDNLTTEGTEFTELVIEIFRINHLLLEVGDQLTEPVGLTSARWQVLGVVEHGPVPVSNVARIMGLTRQTVQQTADGLEEDGLIEFIDNPHHRRAKLMKITLKGRQALDYVVPRQAEWANRIGAKFSVADLQSALQLFRQLRQILEQNTPQPTVNSKEVTYEQT
jgi:DNA-binding MarR family transcriptional regulator